MSVPARHGGLVVTAVAPVLIAVLASGCTPSPATQPAAASSRSRPVATPAVSATSPGSPDSTPTPAAQPPTSAPSAVAALPTTQILAGSGTSLSPGGPALEFTVTITNGTASPIRDFTLVVSMGHCSCIQAPTSPMPAGTMQMWDAGRGKWQSVPYVTEGTGMDFLAGYLVPPFDFARGARITYQLRVALNAAQSATVVNGQATIDVTLEHGPTLPDYRGSISAASLPITVTAG
jgi:hypothetical protein